jgi:hypothetical protein
MLERLWFRDAEWLLLDILLLLVFSFPLLFFRVFLLGNPVWWFILLCYDKGV